MAYLLLHNHSLAQEFDLIILQGTFLISPNLDSTMISRLPRFIFPNETTPSISLTTAGFEGLRASNNSVTRGRPPVISPAFADLRGIFN